MGRKTWSAEVLIEYDQRFRCICRDEILKECLDFDFITHETFCNFVHVLLIDIQVYITGCLIHDLLFKNGLICH